MTTYTCSAVFRKNGVYKDTGSHRIMAESATAAFAALLRLCDALECDCYYIRILPDVDVEVRKE